ncbi:MAG: histidinol dehydrogenase, partial [Planctomycetia bacterium]|jgi:histidinol dehydrogenase
VVPAKVAGVEEVIVCCPVDPNEPNTTTVLAAAHLAGVDRFYRVGGVQAIAAMAFGTETIPRVDLIAGWGNIYETTAKKLLLGQVGIDAFAGPSEICLMADHAHDPSLAAADLLAQAEHSIMARCFLITTDPAYAESVLAQIENQLPATPREKIIKQALEEQGAVILVPDWNRGLEIADALAPEHLMIVTKEDEKIASKVKNAGAVFIGTNTAEALGDYVAGPNHTLPTGGTARFAQALSARTFYRNMSVMKATRCALSTLGPSSMLLAENEGLVAHAEAVRKRLKKLND